jgi:hypothetical protein
MNKNYVLIDYENVQPCVMPPLDKEYFHVIVFVGASQSKVTFEVASELQQLGSRAEYIKISGNGSNAQDFHIAFYIGQIAANDPNACFHIVSKDTGFDPLIQHLKSRKILAARYKAITEIPLISISSSKSVSEKSAAVLANLQQRGTARPRTVKTLGSTINSLFQKALQQTEISAIIKDLEKQGAITITDAKVAYAH